MTAVITLDPTGEVYGLPTFAWRAAPEGMATRRQLSARGLRPNRQAPAAQVFRPRRRRPAEPLVAFLYRVDLAAPKRPMTPAKYAAVRTAARSRQACAGPCGRRDLGYIPPKYTGYRCWDCVGLPTNPERS
jgi:hypothetical protein